REIRFDAVEFAYSSDRPVLDGVSLTAVPGTITAVVGPTGAGKTSLAYMIPGFINPTRGRVMLDGEDIGAMDIEGLRNMTTYVFQEHYLMA
ncbi:MAG TPA: hypothetical protein DCM54_05205, partial [Gammaproteobacteria bacterium]|nr:hypothetical protein [Gammaproteobacteria bacterium]